MNLAARCMTEEVMDSMGLSDAEYARCLGNLATINRLTLTHRPTLAWLGRVTRDLPDAAEISVLDVACGQGDLLRAIGRWARKRGLRARLEGIDLNPRGAEMARKAGGGDDTIAYRTGDVFTYQPDPRPDYIVTSQFTHHLTDVQVVNFIGWLQRHAGRGWMIADLRRHWLAYYAFPVLARLMRWHRVIREDGALSIARSFHPEEWHAYLAQAGVEASVTRHIPFRICVSRPA
jgi:2-polyprenyl-3-methyl-5-hydroxy-6-metoxy-1,4-benzoquinol methylase